MTRFYGAIRKSERTDDGVLVVSGVASSEAIDADGERILASAMREALPAFMKGGRGPLWEMHQHIAAGSVIAAEVDDAGMTMITARVVDPVACLKIDQLVYSGFSIGGRALARDPADRKIITKLALVEISLVDAPSNPQALLKLYSANEAEDEATVFDLVKAALARPYRGDAGLIDLLTKGTR
jgi:hypothetical protein